MNADYITNPLYENNPFIEALPPMLAGKDLIRALASIPPYSDNDRDRSTGERLQLLSSLYEYYQPLSMTIDLYCEVYTALQHCYGQYSVQRETAALQNDYALMQGNASAASIGGGNSFSVIGVSGLGKSTALQRVLSLFPQVIEHTKYHGQNFYYHQIPYLVVQTPHDASIKALILDIYLQIDGLLGTSYQRDALARRLSIPYDVFASINAVADDTERQERLEQLAYLLLPDKANDSEAGVFFCKNGRKMITAALICYYGMGWDFIKICEHFLSNDWRSLLNDIASQQNQTANMYIRSFAGASEQNTAGCKQAADDALKLFATNEKIKNALRKATSYEPSICPATLETNSIYIFIPDEKLKIYGDLLRIITAQSMEYFSARLKENKQMILFCLDEFASFGKLQITESLRKLRKRHIRIMVLTQSLADLDMIYGKDERKAMLGNFKFTVLLGCKDTETQEYFSKMIGDKPSFGDDENKNNRPIIRPAELAHLEQDLYVICDDGAVRLKKNFYFKS